MPNDDFTSKDVRKLTETFKSTEDRRLRDRCQALLMLARGRSRQQVSEDLGVSARTLQRWLRTWRDGGLDALPIEWGPGRTPLIPEELTQDILRWLTAGPRAVGIERDAWTYAELAAHLQREAKIDVSETTMRAFCHKHGARIRRGSPRVRLEPEAVEQLHQPSPKAPASNRPNGKSGRRQSARAANG